MSIFLRACVYVGGGLTVLALGIFCFGFALAFAIHIL